MRILGLAQKEIVCYAYYRQDVGRGVDNENREGCRRAKK